MPKRGVVFSDMQTSYRIAAAAPVLDRRPRRPSTSRTRSRTGRTSGSKDVLEFFRTGDLSIPRRYGARWLVIASSQSHPPLHLRPVYKDARFALYKL